MIGEGQFKREAMANIPYGYYILSPEDSLRETDLIWDWTRKQFLRADSDKWMFSSFTVPVEEMICVIRSSLSGFESASRRTYKVKNG